jgi:hypothetical protein
VWTKLRETKIIAEENKAATDEIGGYENTTKKDEGMDLEALIGDSKIVSIKDRHLVSDTTLVAMAQMSVCQVTEEDKIGRCKDHKLGFKGLCCKVCCFYIVLLIPYLELPSTHFFGFS